MLPMYVFCKSESNILYPIYVLESHKRDIGKRLRLRSDTADPGLGTALSPRLFPLYINDITIESEIRLFADCRQTKTVDDASKLQHDRQA